MNPSETVSHEEMSYTQPNLITLLISGFCERGKNSRAVCDLFIRILSLLKTEMHKEAGIDLDDTVQENRAQRRKRISHETRIGATSAISSVNEESPILLLNSWTQLWIGPICLALLQENKSGRCQISSLFLAKVCTLIGGTMNQLCHIFSYILDELVIQFTMHGCFTNNPHLKEILLWAKLEVRAYSIIYFQQNYILIYHPYEHYVIRHVGMHTCN
jgi:hypothetical protein